MGAYVKSLNQLGEAVVQFNITLIPELIYKPDLLRLLKFEIIPEDDGSDEMDVQKYTFDWDVKGFSKAESTITFQLDFANADRISLGQEEDQITVVVLDRRYFQPAARRLLEGKTPEQAAEIKRQLVTADKAPLNTGVKLIRQMPNDKDSQNLAKKAAQANQAGSIITLLIFIV